MAEVKTDKKVECVGEVLMVLSKYVGSKISRRRIIIAYPSAI